MSDYMWNRRPPLHAVVNDETEAVAEQAVVSLVQLRRLEWGDRLAELHALASLRLELDLRLPDAVVDAADQGHSWSAIAHQLGVTATAVRARYADLVRVPLVD